MKLNDISEVGVQELRAIQINGTGLNKWHSKGEMGVKEVLSKQQRIQLDPLNPAGRQHDILFLSRIQDYKIGQFEKIVYPQQLVFEIYHYGVLCAISIENWSIFKSQMHVNRFPKYAKSGYNKLIQHHPEVLEIARKSLGNNIPVTGKQLSLGKVNQEVGTWKTNQLGSFTLEILWFLGEALIVNRDERFQKWYGSASNFIPQSLSTRPSLSPDEFEEYAFKLLTKSRPITPMGKIRKNKSGNFNYTRSNSVKGKWIESSDEFVVVKLENTDLIFLVSKDWDKLVAQRPNSQMKIIAPLDPLIHDRDLTELVFNFIYKWEVYKPQKNRIWGYYHYPILFEGKLIARIEINYNVKENKLTPFNLILEESVEWTDTHQSALNEYIERWSGFISADSIDWQLKSKSLKN